MEARKAGLGANFGRKPLTGPVRRETRRVRRSSMRRQVARFTEKINAEFVKKLKNMSEKHSDFNGQPLDKLVWVAYL
jgi:hypothetical protein